MWLTHLSPLLQSAYKFMRWGEKSIFLGGRKTNATFPLSHVSENQKWECGVSFSILLRFGIYKWYKNNPCRKNALTIEIQIYSMTNQFIILLSGVPDYFGRNKISSGGDLSHYSSASLY